MWGKYWCDNCKIVLDEDELEKYDEPRPAAYGQPCWETFWVCPCCHDIPTEYDYQDKTCEDCTFYGEEECPYGWEGAREKVCGDFEEGD